MNTPALPIIDRRKFVAGGTAMSAVLLGQSRPAFDRMKVAFIGVGGRGGAYLRAITATGHVDVFALCDVDTRFADHAAEKPPGRRSSKIFE